jgi:hypothetical protein
MTMPSRGIGAVMDSKMPKAKTITRKDDPNKVEMFKRGGLYANIAAKKKRIAAGSGETMRKAGAKGAPKKKDFAQAAKTVSFKKGGTSRVNEAGNYTKPGMRKALFERIKAGGKGGNPGQWSARKAQMLAQQYKKSGGGYRD